MPAAGGRHDWVLAVPALAGLVACRGAGVPGPGGPGPALVASWWASWAWPRPSGAGPGCGALRGSAPWAAAAAGLPLVALLCLRCVLLSVGGAAAAAGAGPGPGCGSDSGPLGPQPARTARTRLRSGPGPAPRPIGWCRLVAWPQGREKDAPPTVWNGGGRELHAHMLGHVLGGVLHGPDGLLGGGLHGLLLPHAAWPTSGQGVPGPLSAPAMQGEVAAGWPQGRAEHGRPMAAHDKDSPPTWSRPAPCRPGAAVQAAAVGQGARSRRLSLAALGPPGGAGAALPGSPPAGLLLACIRAASFRWVGA